MIHGINEGQPDQASGYFIDGGRVHTPWSGKGPLLPNGGIAGTTKDQMAAIFGLKLAAPGEVVPHDLIVTNCSQFYIPSGDAISGKKTWFPKPGETNFTINIRDRNVTQVTVWPLGTGPVTVNLVPTEWRKRWDAGEYLSPDFLARTTQLGACSTRFMDSVKTNGSTVTDVRPLMTDDTWYNGLPVEVLADISNATGTDMVLTVPAHISDKLLIEWIGAAYARLDPRLNLVVEYANEVWNGDFEQSKWATVQGNIVYPGTPAIPAVPAVPANPATGQKAVKGVAAKKALQDLLALPKFYGLMAGRVAKAVKAAVFHDNKPTAAQMLASRVKVSLAWKRARPDHWPYIVAEYKAAGGDIGLINDISFALYPQITTAERDQFIALAQANDIAGGVALIRKVWLDDALTDLPLHMAQARTIGPWVKMNLYETSINQLVMHPPFIKDKTLLPVMVAYCIALTHSPEGVKMYADMHDAFIAAGGTTAHYFTKIGVDSEYGVFNVFSSAQDKTGFPIAAELARRNAQGWAQLGQRGYFGPSRA